MTCRHRTLAVLLFMAATMATAVASPRSKSAMAQAAQQALNHQRAGRHQAPRLDTPVELFSTNNYAVMGYRDGGYAIVATDDLAPAVLGLSQSVWSTDHSPAFLWWLRAAGSAVEYAVAHHTPLQTTTPDPEKYPTDVEPMMTTLWDQETPYNNLCPVYRGSIRCLTGCVATAMAQVLRYHCIPEHGEGQHTIYYPWGNSTTGQPVTATFGEDYYDWANMIDSYDGDYTEEQANAVALLMRDCGVAAEMQYGGPEEGSGTFSNDAAEGLRRYFGIDDAQCVERNHYSEAAWMDMVYRELSENGPLYYGGDDTNVMGGHAFVLHGYQSDGKVYVNWGWSGEDDGYYDIAVLNPSYYRFSHNQDMIIGVKSAKHSQARAETIALATPGTLQQTIEAIGNDDPVKSLTVSGQLSHTDMLYMRHLAGRDADGNATDGSLRTLVLKDALLPGDTIADSLFKDCVSLRRVVLPERTASIGTQAFNGCSSIYELRVPAKEPPVLGSAVFGGIPKGHATLYVRSGLRTRYMQKAQWKDFGADHIVEYGISVKVRNAIRKYGQDNPKFYYYVNGGTIDGVPELTCEATKDSPAGRYPIRLDRGSISSNVEINFIDGYLIVQQLEATATVDDASRAVGEPNPSFSLTFKGLKEDEQEPVWLSEPVFVCEADEESPAGTYPITVTEGMAQSYQMTYVPGTLTVTAPTPTAIAEATTAHSGHATVYSLDGRRLKAAPARGLYIENGRLKGK